MLKFEIVGLICELLGCINVFLVVEVWLQVNGIVVKCLFIEGGMVKVGELLYQIEDVSYCVQVNSVCVQLVCVEVIVNVVWLSVKCIIELVKVDVVSQQDLENVVVVQKQVEVDVGVVRVLLDVVNVILGYVCIIVLISGCIGKFSVIQGVLVSVGQVNVLVMVQQLDLIYVDLIQFLVELLQLCCELVVGCLQDNQILLVSILMEDGSIFEYKGMLEFFEVSVDLVIGSFGLCVKVDNLDGLLMLGMYVCVVIGGGVCSDVVLVLMQGIVCDLKGDIMVMVVGKDNKVEVCLVKVSCMVGDKWLVEEGLKVGDKVIVEGLQKIGFGMLVKVIEKGDVLVKLVVVVQFVVLVGDVK